MKPELLCEVAFTEWTGDGHIRQPAFQGLREDKNPHDVTIEKPSNTQPAKNKNDEKRQKDGQETPPNRKMRTGSTSWASLSPIQTA